VLGDGKIPWRRALLEAVVVVTSILMAFGLNAWWASVEGRQHERRSLSALKGEFSLVRDSLESQRMRREWARHVTEALIAQIQGEPRAPADSLLLWSSGLSLQLDFDPPRAVYDDLVSSGGTQLIRSDSLRMAIAQYASQLELVRHADEQAWTTWEERIQPLLEGRIPRVERLRKGVAGLYGTIPLGPSPHPSQWGKVLADPAFEDVVAERWLRLRIASGRLAAVAPMIDSILRLIDEELDGAELRVRS
jgi:hypothetical protein